MSARSGGLLLITTALLVGCGSAAAGTSPKSSGAPASATTTPAVGTPLVAVVSNSAPIPSPGAQTSTAPSPSATSTLSLQLLSATGSVVASAPLPASPVPNSQAAGADGAYFVDGRGLERLNPSGSVTALAPLTATQEVDFGGMAVAPGGGSLIYAIDVTNPNGSVTTTLYLEKATAAPTVLATLTRGNVIGGVYGGGYLPLAWNSTGLLLGTSPYGVGGTGAFITGYEQNAVVESLNVKTGALSAPLAPSGCLFGGISDQGTVACVEGAYGTNQSIELIHKTKAVVHITPPTNTGVGDLSFLAGTDELAFALTTASAQTAYVLPAGSTSASTLTGGVAVVGWTSSSSVLCTTPAGSSSPVIGVAELVAPSTGKITALAQSVTVVGIAA